MKLKDLTQPQQRALLDLAMLAMYADGHLSSAEDERIVRLLTNLGFSTDSDRGQQYDAAVGRVSRHAQNVATARAYITTLAQQFTTREERRSVLDLMNDLVSSDSRIAPEETSYLAVLQEVFQL